MARTNREKGPSYIDQELAKGRKLSSITPEEIVTASIQRGTAAYKKKHPEDAAFLEDLQTPEGQEKIVNEAMKRIESKLTK